MAPKNQSLEDDSFISVLGGNLGLFSEAKLLAVNMQWWIVVPVGSGIWKHKLFPKSWRHKLQVFFLKTLWIFGRN